MSAEATTRKKFLLAVPVFLAVGLAAAVYLVLVKLKGQYEIGYQSACNLGAKVNCDAVQASDASTVLGIPITIWAIPTYFVMLVLAWFGMQNEATEADEEAPDRAVRATDVLVLLAAGSMVYSVYLAYVQHFVIGAFCLYCATMYGAQLAVLIAATLASPNGIVDSIKNGFQTALNGVSPVAPAAGVFALGLAVGLVWFNHEKDVQFHTGSQDALQRAAAHLGLGELDKADALLSKLTARKDVYTPQAEKLAERLAIAKFAAPVDFEGGGEVWEPEGEPAPVPQPVVAAPTPAPTPAPAVSPQPAAPTQPSPKPKPAAVVVPTAPLPTVDPSKMKCGGKRTEMGWSYCNIPVTADDFVYGNPNAKVTIIEFADFECAFCKMLSQNLKRVREQWKDQIRFVFKFYPMDGACNPRMGGERMHPEGCITAKAAYCAGKQGKFYEAHDKLFAMQKNNQEPKIPGYMKEIGVDVAKWQTCMKGPAPQNRITNDVRIASRAGIHGTPRMYINGRLVSGASSVSILNYYIQAALKNPQMAAKPVTKVAPTAQMAPMAEVTTGKGKSYIDRFEATIDKQGRAISLSGVKPRRASWFQAKAACEKAGKRLCTEEEWASACTGEPAVDNNKNGWFNDDDIEGSRYPYGAFYEAGACHDGQKTLTGDPILTGQMHACRSKGGVYDLTGNIAEWIESDEKKASMVGGNFGSGEGAACNRRGTMFGPGIRNNTTGFRCCADTAVANATNNKADIADLEGDLIGRKVPDFSIKSMDGKTVDASWWKGKVSYITFFASWCGSCKRELPELRIWQEEMGPKGFQVVAIGVDRYSKSSEDFAKKYDPNYTVALDPNSTAMTEFDISAMPTSFVVDKTGMVRQRIVGFKKEEVPGLRALIEKLL